MKKISVIVPVYNVERFLDVCLESIIAQTYTNFELILVDDGSTDSCAQICDAYSVRDNRIRVIHQVNGGLSSARNAALEIVSGEYITFIDSDDFVFPRYLEKLADACESCNADMSICGSIRCSSSDTLKTVVEPRCDKTNEVFVENRMEEFLSSNKISTVAWGKLYKRCLFESLRFPIGKYNEDIFTTYLAIDLADKVVVCDYKGYIYRMNENSIINESFSIKKFDSVEGSLIRAKFIEKKYPNLKKLAYREVIYNCNRVLMSMGRMGEYNQGMCSKLQELYRSHWNTYVLNRSAFFGKVFTLVSCLSVKMAFTLVKTFKL